MEIIKDTVEVIINEGGLTCTTTDESESERKTYEIHSVTCQGVEYTENRCEDGIILQPGSIHQARIENGKAVIL